MIRWGLSELVSEGFNPNWWRGWLLYRVNAGFQNRVWPGRSGIDMESADWDTLIVCDACRYDLFCETEAPSWFDSFDQQTSRASMTREWLEETFPDVYGDIVYVAGNPMVSEHKPESFHALIEAWRDAWDDDLNIITPHAVTGAAIDAREEYPNKRLVIHYMQPHTPFYGHPELQFTSYGDFDEIHPAGSEAAKNVWDAVQRGLVSCDEAWTGYFDNLTYVLEEIKRLLEEDGMGRKVVTSDHGNVFPKWSYPIPIRYSGHPIGHRTPELVTVPWGVCRSSDRPKITDDGVGSETTAPGEDIEANLEALGYQ